MLRKTFWVVLCLLHTLAAWAEVEEDGRIWTSLYMQGKLPVDNLYWSMDTQPRWREEGKHFDTLILRPAIFYKVTPKSSVWLGYDTVINHPAGKSPFTENRLWEQWMMQFEPIGEVTFTSRTRFEQRDKEDYSDIAHRLRQMLRATMPSHVHAQLSWVVWDELFLNLNQTDWGVYRGIDQNRVFIGANWKFSDFSNMDMGYVNQFVNTRSIDRENHILSTILRLNF